MKARTWSILKYLCAVALLALILSHAQTGKISHYLGQIPVLHMVFALSLATVAQFASAMRMRYFFRASGFPLSGRFSLILFYVGAFYNFLLPGGIGGDAYKVLLVRKRMELPVKQGVRIMLADRASGLCIVMLTMLAGLCRLDLSGTVPYAGALIALGIVVTIAGYLFFSRWLLRQSPRTMLMSLPYSVAVQALWVGVLVTVWLSLGNGHYVSQYVILYCAASITGMIPVSVGGLGIKEMTYYYGALLMQRYANATVDAELGIALSLCIFTLLLVASLPGLLWLSKVEKAEFS